MAARVWACMQGLVIELTSMNRTVVMSWWEVITITLAAALAGASWRAWAAAGRRSRLRTTAWPFLGMMPGLLQHMHHLYDWVTIVLNANAGNFQFIGPIFTNHHIFITSDPRNIEYVLRDNFSNFPKGRDFREVFSDLLGHGIFNADHDTWRIQRKPASMHINAPGHKAFTNQTIFRAAQIKLLPFLRHFSSRGCHVDLQDVMLRFTFDVVCVIGFGVDTKSLTAELPVVEFVEAFETALDCTTIRFLLPEFCWKLMKKFKLGKEKAMAEAMHSIDEFANQVISNRRKEIEGKVSVRADLLSCFLSIDDDAFKQDDRFLKDACVNFLLAGRDTSALALSWFFWLLATHPEKEAKLVEEIDAAMESINGELSREMLGRMSYLHAALSESLRLYPSVPFDAKHVIHDDVLPDGHHVKAGHKLMYSIYSMGRMQSIWGADCAAYRPERWLDPVNSGNIVHVSPFQFTAFNAGPRTCLGKDMAYLLMKAVACTVLYNFKIVLVPGQVVEPKLSITLYMKHGLLVSLVPRRPMAY